VIGSCPSRSQVARELIFPFPSPYPYTPHSKIPTPRGLLDQNIHSLGRHREPGSQDPEQFNCTVMPSSANTVQCPHPQRIGFSFRKILQNWLRKRFPCFRKVRVNFREFRESAKVTKKLVLQKKKFAKIAKMLYKTETICTLGRGDKKRKRGRDNTIGFPLKFSFAKFSRIGRQNEFRYFAKYRTHFKKLHVLQKKEKITFSL
jgi:hypothetical protein